MRSTIYSLASLLSLVGAKITPTTDIFDYVATQGITLEEHTVTTPDGYILTAFRMPQPKPAPVVLMQHGILASAWCWLVNENVSQAPAFAAWNQGYDVWLTNNRGNTYGRNHTTLNPHSKEFWNFTFNEMGKYDVKANIDKVLEVSGQATLTFVAWSQGSTQMFIAGTGPDSEYLKSKINLFVALSPVSFMTHQKSLLLGLVSALDLGQVILDIFPFGFLDGSKAISNIEEIFCKLTLGALCKISVDAICGVSKLDEAASLFNLVAHFPAGCPVKDLVHYEQFISKPRFGKFDYGKKNVLEYNQPTPPDYDLAAYTIPTAFFRGSHDDLVNQVDAELLVASVPEDTVVYNKIYTDFSHVTWLVGNRASGVWVDDMLELVHQYNPVL